MRLLYKILCSTTNDWNSNKYKNVTSLKLKYFNASVTSWREAWREGVKINDQIPLFQILSCCRQSVVASERQQRGTTKSRRQSIGFRRWRQLCFWCFLSAFHRSVQGLLGGHCSWAPISLSSFWIESLWANMVEKRLKACCSSSKNLVAEHPQIQEES